MILSPVRILKSLSQRGVTDSQPLPVLLIKVAKVFFLNTTKSKKPIPTKKA